MSAFKPEISLSEIIHFIGSIKNGVTIQTAKEGLWISGCILEKIQPTTDMSTTMSSLSFEDTVDKADELCKRLEAAEFTINNASDSEELSQAAADKLSIWEALLPILIDLGMKLIQEWLKKRQPAPSPTAGTLGAKPGSAPPKDQKIAGTSPVPQHKTTPHS